MEFPECSDVTGNKVSSLRVWLPLQLSYYKFQLRSALLLFFFFSFLSFCYFFGATPVAYGDSQARGLIGDVATDLRQSHSNTGSEPGLQPTPQLTATPDRQTRNLMVPSRIR